MLWTSDYGPVVCDGSERTSHLKLLFCFVQLVISPQEPLSTSPWKLWNPPEVTKDHNERNVKSLNLQKDRSQAGWQDI